MHELPMILFTVLSQMSVGAFVALGFVQTFASAKYSARVVDRVAAPALLAIGPTLVLGLLASMFHMNDVMNTFNVIRHWDSSWLSREILFGVGFAGLGFLFFVAQWRGIGSPRMRQVLAGLTAIVGLGLVWSQSMIYYSLVTVPGWHHWTTPLRFFATTVMLGALAVGVALAITLSKCEKGECPTQGGAAADETQTAEGTKGTLAVLTKQVTLTEDEAAEAETLVRSALKLVAMVTVVTAMILFVTLPVYTAYLAAEPSGAAAVSAANYSGGFFIARLVLLAVGAVGLALYGYRATALGTVKATALSTWVFLALAITFISEIMGRSLFYDTMARVGM